jgi:cation diffusion facilitator family transporter
LIGVVVVFVVVEAVRRLGGEPPEVQAPWYALVLLVVSIVVDAARVAYLITTARAADSDALRAGALNIAGDLGTAMVALLSLVFVRAGVLRADAIGALVVAVLVASIAVRIGKRSVDVLMDKAPSQQAQAIEMAAAGAPGVQAARRVRLRGSGEKLFADVTVAAGRTSSLERAHDIAEGVERAIEEVAPGTDVVVHVEPTAEFGGLVERVQAAAGRSGAVHEIHNVNIHAFNEGGVEKLHVTLHAKVNQGVSLEDAHELSDTIEQAVTLELAREVRVDTHIEPLESAAFARDVTEDRADLVDEVKTIALKEVEVLDCHEVLVTDLSGSLAVVAHVTGRHSAPLTDMHEASERIETALRVAHPEVRSVLIHFEPARPST